MPDLTPEEHAEAQKIAYQKCLERSNGQDLPSYHFEAAVGDFLQAAGEVIARRGTRAAESHAPRILPDGTHIFPIESLLGQDGTPILGAAGELRWSPKDGLTYHFEFPHASMDEAAPSTFGMVPRPPDGSISDIPDAPSWSGGILGGGTFALFGAGGTVNTQHNSVGGVFSSRSTADGKSSLGTVTLSIDDSLAFRHDTPALRREFLPSFSLLSWPDIDEVRYTDGATQHRRMRNRVILQTEPRLTVYLGSSTLGVPQGVWLVDEGSSPPSDRIPSDTADDARAFLSFLVGRNLPFFWRDTFPGNGQVQRLYVGALRPHSPILGNEQPVPLHNIREAFTVGVPIGHRLPPLFARFREVRQQYNLDFVLSPLWTAFNGYVDDKLAEACVSLERLSTAHTDYLRTSGREQAKFELLTHPQATALREALLTAATKVATAYIIPPETLTIIERKIANIHQPPNADKLELVFTHVGITLRNDEEDAIKNRNRTLHGRATLGGQDLAAIAAELRRFDILRTLINKAILRLLNYTGPYVDYGDHPDGTAYTIKEII